LKEMMLPGAMTILFPLVIGFLPMVFGYNGQEAAEMLGGYMAGVAVSGVLWAIFQNNAGGAWDNAKKSFEAGVMIDGEMTFKGSDAHKAAVTGDTVGDPFKDTSGPSMNILIKLTCLVGLVIAPILGEGHGEAAHDGATVEVTQEVMRLKLMGVDVMVNGLEAANAKANVDATIKEGRLEATITLTSETISGTFTALEGMFDGNMFHATGNLVTEDGVSHMADVDFFKDQEGTIRDFNFGIHN
jgi:hypothetical protein